MDGDLITNQEVKIKNSTIMAIKLEKGQRINLEKDSGAKLTRFMVGCNWGALKTGRKIEVVDSEGFLGFGRKTHLADEEVDLDIDRLALSDTCSGNFSSSGRGGGHFVVLGVSSQ